MPFLKSDGAMGSDAVAFIIRQQVHEPLSSFFFSESINFDVPAKTKYAASPYPITLNTPTVSRVVLPHKVIARRIVSSHAAEVERIKTCSTTTLSVGSIPRLESGPIVVLEHWR